MVENIEEKWEIFLYINAIKNLQKVLKRGKIAKRMRDDLIMPIFKNRDNNYYISYRG